MINVTFRNASWNHFKACLKPSVLSDQKVHISKKSSVKLPNSLNQRQPFQLQTYTEWKNKQGSLERYSKLLTYQMGKLRLSVEAAC